MIHADLLSLTRPDVIPGLIRSCKPDPNGLYPYVDPLEAKGQASDQLHAVRGWPILGIITLPALRAWAAAPPAHHDPYSVGMVTRTVGISRSLLHRLLAAWDGEDEVSVSLSPDRLVFGAVYAENELIIACLRKIEGAARFSLAPWAD